MGGGSHGVMVKTMDCGIIASSNSSRAIAAIYRLNSTTIILLEGWLRH